MVNDYMTEPTLARGQKMSRNALHLYLEFKGQLAGCNIVDRGEALHLYVTRPGYKSVEFHILKISSFEQVRRMLIKANLWL